MGLSLYSVFVVLEVTLEPLFLPENLKGVYRNALNQVGGAIGYFTDSVLNAFNLLSPKELSAYQAVKKILTDYPFPSFQALLDGKVHLSLATVLILTLELLFALLTGLFFLWLDFKVLRPFFLRTAKKEPPLELGDVWPVNPSELTGVKLERIQTYFTEGGLDEIMRTADARIPKPNKDDPVGVVRTDSDRVEREERKKRHIVFNRKRITREVRKRTESLFNFARKLHLVEKEDEEVFRVSLGLALFHHVLDFFGGIPLGFITPRVKDYTVKRVLASYGYRDKVPIAKFGNVFYGEELKPSRFLTALHGYCNEKDDLFDRLKDEFCQIPGWDEMVPIKKKIV